VPCGLFSNDKTRDGSDRFDRINLLGEAYVILAKSTSEERLKPVVEVIAAKRISLTVEKAQDWVKRALRFKQERGRAPPLTAAIPWEKQIAEGAAFLQWKVKEKTEA
jgi:hypothetical protein